MQDRIEYEALVQKALRNVIRDVLADVAENGLPGDHHFYITFFTQKPGVQISSRLKERFPETMTIVLQHRFWDMELLDDAFTVTLSFDGIAEKLVVPFSAMQLFYDPTAAFEVAFNTDADNSNSEAPVEIDIVEDEDDAPDSNESEIVSFPQQTSSGKEDHSGPTSQHYLNLPRNFIDALNKSEPDVHTPTKKEDATQTNDAEDKAHSDKETSSDKTSKKEKSARIVSLDAFRKK